MCSGILQGCHGTNSVVYFDLFILISHIEKLAVYLCCIFYRLIFLLLLSQEVYDRSISSVYLITAWCFVLNSTDMAYIIVPTVITTI